MKFAIFVRHGAFLSFCPCRRQGICYILLDAFRRNHLTRRRDRTARSILSLLAMDISAARSLLLLPCEFYGYVIYRPQAHSANLFDRGRHIYSFLIAYCRR